MSFCKGSNTPLTCNNFGWETCPTLIVCGYDSRPNFKSQQGNTNCNKGVILGISPAFFRISRRSDHFLLKKKSGAFFAARSAAHFAEKMKLATFFASFPKIGLPNGYQRPTILSQFRLSPRTAKPGSFVTKIVQTPMAFPSSGPGSARATFPQGKAHPAGNPYI